MTKISTPPSLLEAFENLDEPTKQILADINSQMLLGFVVLFLAKSKVQRIDMSAEHIVAALEAAGVSTKRQNITNAFSRAGRRISRKDIDGEVTYSLMTSGRREVEVLFENQGEINVSYVEGGKPRTARKILSDILGNLSGEVKICDPYYGLRTLDALEMIPATCSVKFLSAQTNEKIAKLAGPISDFRRERPNTEIRIFPDTKALHDRYVLSATSLLILGQGIKDIGNKESFVISIAGSYAKDMLEILSRTFDERWKISSIL